MSRFVVNVIHHVFDYDAEDVTPAKFYSPKSSSLFPLPKVWLRIDGLTAHLQKMSLL